MHTTIHVTMHGYKVVLSLYRPKNVPRRIGTLNNVKRTLQSSPA